MFADEIRLQLRVVRARKVSMQPDGPMLVWFSPGYPTNNYLNGLLQDYQKVHR